MFSCTRRFGHTNSLAIVLCLATWGTDRIVQAAIPTAVDSGFYNHVGRHSKLDGSPSFGGATPATFNYSVGTIDEGPPFGPPGSPPDVFRKNYFTFDLAGVAPGSVAAGSLFLFLPPGGYAGPASLTYKLYGSVVPGPVELGDSKLAMLPDFGSVTLTTVSAGTTIVVPLSAFGVSYLNMFAGGKVVISGELDGVTTTGPPDDPAVFLFGFSSPVISGVVPWSLDGIGPTPTPTLEITLQQSSAVPEPSSWMILGMLALCFLSDFHFIVVRAGIDPGTDPKRPTLPIHMQLGL